MKFWLTACFVFLLGCVSLKEDVSISAMEANYPTAEFLFDNERFKGGKIFAVTKNQQLADLNLFVQGFFNGTIKVDSSNCDLDLAIRYKDSESIRIPLFGTAEKSCFISFVVLPEYSDADKEIIYGFKGVVALKVLETSNLRWFGETYKIQVESEKTLTIPVKSNQEVDAFFFGCGKSVSKTIEIKNSQKFEIPFKEILSPDIKTCVLSGVLIPQNEQEIYIDLLIFQYSDGFLDLSLPSVEFKNDKICLQADKAVSFIMTEKGEYNKSSGCFKASEFIRGVSVKGRSFLGEIKEGEILWK